MNSFLMPLAVLVALAILSPLLRVVVAAVFGKQVGQAALAKLPDAIHLAPVTDRARAWRNGASVDAIAAGLRANGFEPAGDYTIPELSQMTVRFLANPASSCYASIYEHPKAGVWFEVYSRYADGTSATFTTSRPNGIDTRPGHPVTHLPGQEVGQVLETALARRPTGVLALHATDRVAREFESAFAESMAWRKGHGVSTREVVNVAIKKAA